MITVDIIFKYFPHLTDLQKEQFTKLYDVYKECCLRVVDTVMSAKGRSHAFQKFYDLIEKESGGRIDSKCRDLYFQCLLSVDDVSCRKKQVKQVILLQFLEQHLFVVNVY